MISKMADDTMVRALLLDFRGFVASLAIGAMVLFFSGTYWLQNFTLLLAFLLLSVAVTRWRHEEKREKGLYEHERGWKNVLSNGGVPALCCLAYYLWPSQAWIAAFVCSLSAAAADKFASELGVLSGKPIDLRTLRPTKPGTSGAVSGLGTWMSFIGALSISLMAYAMMRFDPIYIFIIAVFGFLGGLADTFVGVLEEMGIGTKSSSNIICTLVGAALGYLFISL